MVRHRFAAGAAAEGAHRTDLRTAQHKQKWRGIYDCKRTRHYAYPWGLYA
jgi:hypothetical protein